MSLSLFHLAIVGIFILIIMAIVSNTSETAFTAFENQIFLMNCPYPIFAGLASNLNIDGLTVTYDLLRDNSTSDFHLTVFNCGIIDPDIPTYSVSTTVFTNAANWFTSATGFLAYAMHGIYAVAGQIQSILTIFSFILSPANFSLLGYGLADLSGAGLMVVIGIYIISYVFVAVWLYVTFNPFKGSSS